MAEVLRPPRPASRFAGPSGCTDALPSTPAACVAPDRWRRPGSAAPGEWQRRGGPRSQLAEPAGPPRWTSPVEASTRSPARIARPRRPPCRRVDRLAGRTPEGAAAPHPAALPAHRPARLLRARDPPRAARAEPWLHRWRTPMRSPAARRRPAATPPDTRQGQARDARMGKARVAANRPNFPLEYPLWGAVFAQCISSSPQRNRRAVP